jgi:hypothetical protein
LRLINYNGAAGQASLPGELHDVYIPRSQPPPELKKLNSHWHSRFIQEVCWEWGVRKGMKFTFGIFFRNPLLFSETGQFGKQLLLFHEFPESLDPAPANSTRDNMVPQPSAVFFKAGSL